MLRDVAGRSILLTLCAQVLIIINSICRVLLLAAVLVCVTVLFVNVEMADLRGNANCTSVSRAEFGYSPIHMWSNDSIYIAITTNTSANQWPRRFSWHTKLVSLAIVDPPFV